MMGLDIHPEELIDKLAEGTLTLAERERLDTHLAQCLSCRFEIAVRADLAEDAPALQKRPQMTPAGGAERVLGSPPELAAPRASLRARGKRRWPLLMLAAALTLCAGGAMAAVVTGAVGGRWLPWSIEPKQGDSGVRVSDAKPGAKLKRAPAEPNSGLAPAPASEASASSALPTLSAGRVASPEPSAALIAHPAASSLAPVRPAEPALSAPGSARAAVGVSAAPPAAAGSSELPAARAAAAGLFAEANRARRDGNVELALSLYRALQSRYPSSSESDLSRALLAQLLLDHGNPEGALAGFDRYLAQDSPVLAAEALVGRARALEQLGKPTEAEAAWRLVQSRYPGSVHARLAATRLAALGMR